MRTFLLIAAIGCLLIVETSFGQLRANRRPPRPSVTLPDEPIRQIILSRCTACHGIDEYGYYAMDREAWHALIERMKTATSGAVTGTQITADEQEMLLDWLVSEFGPDATPFEREYVVREITGESRLTDAQARARLEELCSGCHSPLDSVLAMRLGEDAWRATLTGKIATGVPLLVDEVDPLIDWLSRTYNTQ